MRLSSLTRALEVRPTNRSFASASSKILPFPMPEGWVGDPGICRRLVCWNKSFIVAFWAFRFKLFQFCRDKNMQGITLVLDQVSLVKIGQSDTWRKLGGTRSQRSWWRQLGSGSRSTASWTWVRGSQRQRESSWDWLHFSVSGVRCNWNCCRTDQFNRDPLRSSALIWSLGIT